MAQLRPVIRMLVLGALVLGTLALGSAGARAREEFPRRAPFTAIRFAADRVELEVQGTWYGLRTLDGIRTEELVVFAKATYSRKWQKRLREDLVEVLTKMGHKPGRTVALELKRISDGAPVSLAAVPMTEANRAAARSANRSGGRSEPSARQVQRVRRSHATRVPAAFEFLSMAVPGAEDRRVITRAMALEDLDQLEWLVQHVHAYATLRDLDIAAAFDAVRLGIGAETPRSTFAIQLMKLIALFGDGHAKLDENPNRIFARGYLPFLISDAEGGTVAYRQDRSGFVDPKRPYLTKLDGLPLRKWVQAAESLVAHGSPQLVRRRALRRVRYLQQLRRELGLPEQATLSFELTGPGGKRAVTRQLALAERKPSYGNWPRAGAPPLHQGANIGYLRIARMDREAAAPAALTRAMEDLKGTRGLIIDLRGNGGGTRDALRLLLPYFLDRGESIIANVAAYRLPPGSSKASTADALENRSLFPADASPWRPAQRKLIQEFAASFQPGWRFPEASFGAWCYLVIENKGESRYKKPTVVLIDAGCFSATDIFVGAFATRAQVTLLGTATSGGSGRTQRYKLAHSRLDVRLSSMASFRPDGSLYDTLGIAPAVQVLPQPADLLGEGDRVLEAALERLR